MEILTYIIFFLNFKNKNKWSKNVEKHKKKVRVRYFLFGMSLLRVEFHLSLVIEKKNFVLAPLAQNFSMTSCFVLTPPLPPQNFGHIWS